MDYKKSFVFYESVDAQVRRLVKRGKRDLALDLMLAVTDYGLRGLTPPEDSELWDYGLDGIMASINGAKVRYNKAVENGQKGGRAPKIADEDQANIAQLKKEHYTAKQIAAMYDVSEKTILRSPGWNGQNGQNLNVNDNENDNENASCPSSWNGQNGQNGQNLNDNVNENVNENENVYDNVNDNIYDNEYDNDNINDNTATSKPLTKNEAFIAAVLTYKGTPLEKTARILDKPVVDVYDTINPGKREEAIKPTESAQSGYLPGAEPIQKNEDTFDEWYQAHSPKTTNTLTYLAPKAVAPSASKYASYDCDNTSFVPESDIDSFDAFDF